MRTRAGELSSVHDQILLANRPPLEPAFKDLADAGGITSLSRQRAPRNMWCHPVMRHRASRMVPRRRLREPNVARISRELPAVQGTDDGVAIADLAARRIHEIGA